MKKITVRTMVLMALLIALSIILTRLLSIQILPYARFSLGSLPIFLAGLLLGPLAGGLTGALADTLGAMLLSPFGWYPPLTLPPLLIGVVSGLAKPLLGTRNSVARAFILTLSTDLVVNGLLGSLLLAVYIGSPWISLLPVRLPLELGKAVCEAFLIFILYRRLQQATGGLAGDAAR